MEVMCKWYHVCHSILHPGVAVLQWQFKKCLPRRLSWGSRRHNQIPRGPPRTPLECFCEIQEIDIRQQSLPPACSDGLQSRPQCMHPPSSSGYYSSTRHLAPSIPTSRRPALSADGNARSLGVHAGCNVHRGKLLEEQLRRIWNMHL